MNFKNFFLLAIIAATSIAIVRAEDQHDAQLEENDYFEGDEKEGLGGEGDDHEMDFDHDLYNYEWDMRNGSQD